MLQTDSYDATTCLICHWSEIQKAILLYLMEELYPRQYKNGGIFDLWLYLIHDFRGEGDVQTGSFISLHRPNYLLKPPGGKFVNSRV